MLQQQTVPCQWCSTETRMTATKECDRCHELSVRISHDMELAARIFLRAKPELYVAAQNFSDGFKVLGICPTPNMARTLCRNDHARITGSNEFTLVWTEAYDGDDIAWFCAIDNSNMYEVYRTTGFNQEG